MNCIFLLAEDVSNATFGRWNIQGCIWGDRIAVPHLPYLLRTNMVAIFQFPDRLSKLPETSILVQFCPARSDGQPVGEEAFPNVSDLETMGPARSAKFTIPIRWWLFELGTLRVDIKLDGVSHSFDWLIETGPGPTQGPGAPEVTAAILGSTSSAFDAQALASSATSDLVIVDPYLPPADLLTLIAGVGRTTAIRVLIPPKDKSTFVRAKATLLAVHPMLEVRVSSSPGQTGPFHDRFMIINSAEVYWFGTSIKQLSGGRVTRVAKIFNHGEVTFVVSAFDSEWTNAHVI